MRFDTNKVPTYNRPNYNYEVVSRVMSAHKVARPCNEKNVNLPNVRKLGAFFPDIAR